MTENLYSYEKVFRESVSGFNSTEDRMKLILGWIAFAKRPLRKAEFRSALAFSTGKPDTVELVPSYVFEKCMPLVEERKDSTFAFVHVTVRE